MAEVAAHAFSVGGAHEVAERSEDEVGVGDAAGGGRTVGGFGVRIDPELPARGGVEGVEFGHVDDEFPADDDG